MAERVHQFLLFSIQQHAYLVYIISFPKTLEAKAFDVPLDEASENFEDRDKETNTEAEAARPPQALQRHRGRHC